MKKTIVKSFKENKRLNDLTIKKLLNKILIAAQIIKKTIDDNNNIIWCGNGGSAAQSEHFAAELVGRYKKKRKPIKSISLSANTSTLTCISNDFGYANIFARQLKGIANKNDLLIVFSTSGNSKNIIKAINQARQMNLKTISFLGYKGGLLKNRGYI